MRGGDSGDTYCITSLYYDTPDYGVFYKNGSHGRAKYRIRRYDQSPTVFLERKLRTHGTVTKRRTLVPLKDLEMLHEPWQSWRGDWFRRRVTARGMAPSCQISYQRTALVGMTREGLIRLTLDEGLCAAPVIDAAFRPLAACTQLNPGHCILEMKFRLSMPAAFKNIVSELQLHSQPISKYRIALPVLGLARDPAPAVNFREERLAIYA
jgi:hypothetical protein